MTVTIFVWPFVKLDSLLISYLWWWNILDINIYNKSQNIFQALSYYFITLKSSESCQSENCKVGYIPETNLISKTEFKLQRNHEVRLKVFWNLLDYRHKDLISIKNFTESIIHRVPVLWSLGPGNVCISLSTQM